ncbi:hypothetical protein LTR95_009376 [Oleoguttula sp. CCFEE 5521]
MSDQPRWTYSERLNAYYYHDTRRSEYVTQAGQRYPAAALGSGTAAPRNVQPRPPATLPPSADPRDLPSSPPQDPGYLTERSGTSFDARRAVSARVPSALAGSSTERAHLPQTGSNAERSPREAPRTIDPIAAARHNYEEHRDPATLVTTRIARIPSQSSADGSLRLQQAAAGRILLGTPGEQERLNPAYKRRDQPNKFFVVGRVFLILWVEPKGESKQGYGSLVTYQETLRGKYNEPIYSDIRRFVVVRMGEQSCTALPIRTYSGRSAVQRRDQAENGIIYAGKLPPRRPRQEPALLPDAIRVELDDQNDTLDRFSRINYGTVYTIEHNVKVKACGMVNRDHFTPLLSQFTDVFVTKIGVREPQAPITVMNAQLPGGRQRSGLAGKSSAADDDDEAATRRRAAQSADIARHIAAAELASGQGRLRSRREERTPTAGSRVSGVVDNIVEDSDEDEEQSDDDGDDDNDADGVPRRRVTSLTTDERQRLRASFARVEATLIKRGLSRAEAAAEAKTVVTTEVAKLVSNARDKSRAPNNRESQDVRSSADALNVKRSALSHIVHRDQARRESAASSSKRPTAATLSGAATAMQSMSLGTGSSGEARVRSSGSRDRGAATSVERRIPDGALRPGPPTSQQRVAQPSTADTFLSAETLAQRGWPVAEIATYRSLVAEGWRSSSAQNVVALTRRGLPLSTATEVASVMEDGYSLEDAIARIRGTGGTQSKSTKGKERER